MWFRTIKSSVSHDYGLNYKILSEVILPDSLGLGKRICGFRPVYGDKLFTSRYL